MFKFGISARGLMRHAPKVIMQDGRLSSLSIATRAMAASLQDLSVPYVNDTPIVLINQPGPAQSINFSRYRRSDQEDDDIDDSDLPARKRPGDHHESPYQDSHSYIYKRDGISRPSRFAAAGIFTHLPCTQQPCRHIHIYRTGRVEGEPSVGFSFSSSSSSSSSSAAGQGDPSKGSSPGYGYSGESAADMGRSQPGSQSGSTEYARGISPRASGSSQSGAGERDSISGFQGPAASSIRNNDDGILDRDNQRSKPNKGITSSPGMISSDSSQRGDSSSSSQASASPSPSPRLHSDAAPHARHPGQALNSQHESLTGMIRPEEQSGG